MTNIAANGGDNALFLRPYVEPYDYMLKINPLIKLVKKTQLNLKHISVSPTDEGNCQNGGVFNPQTMRCDCPEGFTGLTCELLGLC